MQKKETLSYHSSKERERQRRNGEKEGEENK